MAARSGSNSKARLRHRRSGVTPGYGLAGSTYRVGDWWVEPDRHRIRDRDGEERRLEPRLASLLQFFAERCGEVVGKEAILDGVWGTRYVADSALTRAVAELRRELGDDAQNPTYIETIPKRGYRLLAEVRCGGPPSGGSWRPRILMASFVTAVVIGGVVAADWIDLRHHGGESQEMRRTSIAVLPLVDLSPASGEEYFADSVTDALTTMLARFPHLSVTSRRSVEQFRDSEASSGEIARVLCVDTLIEGTILRDSGRVRITAQLIDPQAERHLWAGSYERQLRDVVSLQGEIVSAIAGEIEGSLAGNVAPYVAAGPVDPEAHDLYLRGRYLLNSGSFESRRRVPELFRRALEEDPTYAPAWSGLSDYYVKSCARRDLEPGVGYPQAKAAALKALELDPALAEAHASLGTTVFLHEWDWGGAERHFRRALELSPSHAGAHRQYAFFLTCMGRFEEAIVHGEEALQLDPLTPLPRRSLAWVYWNAGRYDDALRTLRGSPPGVPRGGGTRMYEAWIHALAGRSETAIEILDASSGAGEPGADLRLASLGWSLARGGRVEEAHRLLTDLEAQTEAGIDPYLVAIVAAGLGDSDTALDWLERGLERRSMNMVFLKVEPFLQSLRDEERYRRLLERMRL